MENITADTPYPNPFPAVRTDEEILNDITDRLSALEVQLWFRRALPELRDVVLAMAHVDGFEAAVRGVRDLYVAWLQQPRRR